MSTMMPALLDTYQHVRDAQHVQNLSEAPMVSSNPEAIPVALFGWGTWSRRHWFPVLVRLARQGVLRLSVVDRWHDAPVELADLEQEGALTYVPWEDCFASPVASDWRTAFVVTNADRHAHVISGLLEQASNLRAIVCEKPCGQSLAQARTLFTACQRRAVALLVADHYLLRPPVQHLIDHPEYLRALGEIVQCTASLDERQEMGPDQGVMVDMLIHLLTLLHVVVPGAHFMPQTSYSARARHHAHTSDETYALCVGHLVVPGHPDVSCQLECGKQLAQDRKHLTFVGTQGRLHLDLITNSLTLNVKTPVVKDVYLQWNQPWSYAKLILRSLSPLSPPAGQLQAA